MTRATRGHTGRELSADRVTGALYLLVNLAAAMRVAAAFAFDWSMPLLAVQHAYGLPHLRVSCWLTRQCCSDQSIVVREAGFGSTIVTATRSTSLGARRVNVSKRA